MRRKCSLRIPEWMAERLTGVGAWDREHEQTLVAYVCHDDLGLARVPIPLERDRVISVTAYVQVDEHDRLLSGSGHRSARSRFEASMVRDAPPAASAFAGLVMRRTARPRVAKP